MKVVEKLSDFPAKPPILRGLNAEAYQLLQGIHKSKPVLKVDVEGQNVAAVKRAFARAAKELGGSTRSQNAEDGYILVKWEADGIHRRGPAKTKVEHSETAVEAEAKRLYLAAGNKEGDYGKLSPAVKKKLTTSAKRNLSRAEGRGL